MNTITLTIAATPSNLMKLAQAFGDSIDGILGAEDVPVTHYQDKVRTPEGAETKPAVTKTDVRQKALELTKAGETAKVEEVFARFGAKKFTQLKESDYADVLEALEAVS